MSGSAVLIVTGLAEDFSISGGEGSGNPFATAFMSTCGIFGERDSGKDLPDPRKSWFPRSNHYLLRKHIL